jgi:hypothetical protein
MARWIQNVELSDPEVVGYTVVAGWWPTTFHRVITLPVKVLSATDGHGLLTRRLCEMFPEKCGPPRDYYVTRVHKTDRYGVPKSENPKFETECSDRAGACEGHRQIVAALAKGKRSLFRPPSNRKVKNC